MSFDEGWIAGGFGGGFGDQQVDPGESVTFTVELYNQHLTDFGDYDRTALMDAVVKAERSDGETDVIARYDRVRLPPGRSQINLVEKRASYTMPAVEEVEIVLEWEYEAPDQGTFSGSNSRTLTGLSADVLSVVDCSVASSASVGDEVPVSVTVANSAGVEVEANVTVSAAGESGSESVLLGSGAESSVEVVFAFDSPGEYEPSVEVGL